MRECGIVNSVEKFYVGFSGETTVRILRLLKPGFRHCFLFFGDENYTFVVDPILNRIDLSFLPLGIENTLQFFKANGIKIIYVPKRFEMSKGFSLGIFTCVEVVKRILGISKISIVTPFRLYKFLKKLYCGF